MLVLENCSANQVQQVLPVAFLKHPYPLGGPKRGGTYQKCKLQYPGSFGGGEGDLQKCNLHFWRSPFVGGGGGGVRKCKLDLSNV